MNLWDRELKIGSTDFYSVTVNDKWLDGEALLSATVTVTSDNDPTKIILGTSQIGELKTVFLRITGVAEGYHTVHFEYATATRSDCYEAVVHVVEC